MDLKPKQKLTNEETERGLRLIIMDGLAAEAMTTFTGGAFVIVMAVLLGASNTQIGIVAALAEWSTPDSMRLIPLIALRGWNFLFLAGALLAMIALEILVHVREVGEVEKELVIRIMRKSMNTSLKDFFIISTLVSWHEQLWQIIKRRLTL